MNLKQELTNIAKNAQEASRFMLTVSSATKNKVLQDMALSLRNQKKVILRANKNDIKKAKALRSSPAFIDRLSLSDKRIKQTEKASKKKKKTIKNH
jgi:glutamate-5-semialdehyde dehydrogenase